jgi:hypothetical protein
MKPLLGYLSSTYLELFWINNREHFSFPSEAVQYGEIIDANKLKEVLLQFISKLNLKKGKGIVILSQELVFSSEIDISSGSEGDKLEQFLTTVPLAEDNIAAISLKNKSRLNVYAANKQLYEIISEVFKQIDIEIYSVAPVNVLPVKSKNITTEQVGQILNEKKLLETYNFLHSKQQSEANHDVEQSDSLVQNETKKDMKKQYIMFGISLLFLVGAIIYFLLWSGAIVNPWFKKSISLPAKTNLAPTPTIISRPTTKTFDKTTVVMQILNGSGIEGEAEKLRDLLLEAGYKDIVTGDANQLEGSTSMIYDKQLSKSEIASVSAIIRKDFPNVFLQEATQSVKYNIIIILGKNL